MEQPIEPRTVFRSSTAQPWGTGNAPSEIRARTSPDAANRYRVASRCGACPVTGI